MFVEWKGYWGPGLLKLPSPLRDPMTVPLARVASSTTVNGRLDVVAACSEAGLGIGVATATWAARAAMQTDVIFILAKSEFQ